MARLWNVHEEWHGKPDAPLALMKEYAAMLYTDTDGRFSAYVREEPTEQSLKYSMYVRVPGLTNDYVLFRAGLDWNSSYPARLWRFDLQARVLADYSRIAKSAEQFREYVEDLIRAKETADFLGNLAYLAQTKQRINENA